MTGSIRLLSEAESADAAAVSLETIRQYRDCGLLDPVLKDNQTYFQEIDIQTLFFTNFKNKQSEAAPRNDAPPAPLAASIETISDGKVNERISDEPIEPARVAAAIAPAPQIAAQPEPVQSEAAKQPELKPETTKPAEVQPVTEVSGDEGFRFHDAIDASPPAPSMPSPGELISLNRSLRDQIQVLREERDWLRERIEKLESRSEREQMLLLSESENVRKLISSTQKGFWQRALPWFGPRTESK